MRPPLLTYVVLLLACVLPAAAATKPTHALPPVPAAAREDLANASEVIEMLMRRPDKAVGSGEWDVVIERLMKAQEKAPESPQILNDLGLAQEMRGRNLAAIDWFTAAWWATKDVDLHLPQVRELYKRIGTLNRKVEDEIELLLRFAKDEVPYIHTTVAPQPEGEVMHLPFPPRAVVLGDHIEILPNGEGHWVHYPAPEIPKEELEEYIIELELSIGYYKAIQEAVEYGQKYCPGVEIDVHYTAFQAVIDVYTKAGDWATVSSLSSSARTWAEGPGRGSSSLSEAFEKSRLEANEKVGQENPKTKVAQWIALAKEQSKSDDEVLLDAKIENLRHGATKDVSLLEGVAKILKPIGYGRLRQSAVTSVYSVGCWD